MKATNIDFFRETPKTILRGLFLLVLPIAGTIYMFKYDRVSIHFSLVFILEQVKYIYKCMIKAVKASNSFHCGD